MTHEAASRFFAMGLACAVAGAACATLEGDGFRKAGSLLGVCAGLAALADALVRPRRSPLAFFGGLKGVALVAALLAGPVYLTFQCRGELEDWAYVVAHGRPATGRIVLSSGAGRYTTLLHVTVVGGVRPEQAARIACPRGCERSLPPGSVIDLRFLPDDEEAVVCPQFPPDCVDLGLWMSTGLAAYLCVWFVLKGAVRFLAP